MAYFASDARTPQTPPKSGGRKYDTLIESPEYPVEVQVQIYKPPSAPFYGQTTAGESFQKWDIKPAQKAPVDRREQPKIPFTGRSTSAMDFVAHPSESPRRPLKESTVYVPSDAPFYGQTTAGESFQKWDIKPAQKAPVDRREQPSIPFQGESEYDQKYRRWSLGKRRLSVGIALHGGIFHPLISGLERLPANGTEMVTTVQDNQRVAALVLYMGERKIACENMHIGTLKIPDVKPAPCGVPRFQVLLSIDATNALSLRVQNMDTGKWEHATFTTALEEQEVTNHLDAARNAREEDHERANYISKVISERHKYVHAHPGEPVPPRSVDGHFHRRESDPGFSQEDESHARKLFQ
jgi:hypothetical protein